MASHRLPRCVLPGRYVLDLSVDLETCKTVGKLSIHVQITEPTSLITLNVADLIVDPHTVRFELQDDQLLHVKGFTVNEQDQLLLLDFGLVLPPGKGVLFMNYEGFLNNKLDGFYSCSYQIGGVKKTMAASTFEPADARSCFPCWDEPEFKATYKITVHAPSDRTILSNMPAVAETSNGATKTVEFQESVLMSTYLVAIVIGEFEYMEAVSEDGVLCRAYTQQGDLHKAKFAFDMMLKLLPYFAQFFQLPLPLPKLDFVAVPEFKAGAIENFGLVVFRNEAMLVDESSSASHRESVANAVAHELAHMWFGNTVTIEWWTHLWLNEGMATWMSYMAVDYLFPGWNIWEEFYKEVMHAFKLDSLAGTHPVEVEVGHVRETMEAFDAISYCKGASVVYMLQHYLGKEAVQRGLIRYMERFIFSNAKSDDLWDCFSAVTGKPIQELMCSWTKQKGYPFVKVTSRDEGKLMLEQAQFRADGETGEGKWMIPITICCGCYETETEILLTETKMEIDLATNSWVKLNAGQAGFYHVQYDDKLQSSLKSAISSGSLNPIDRLGILSDTFVLYQAGKQSLCNLMSLLLVYKAETQPSVLSEMITIALTISDVIAVALPNLSPKFNSYLSKLLENQARNLGWEASEGESHLNATLRQSLLHAMVCLDDEQTKLEAKTRFENRGKVRLASYCCKAAYTSIIKRATSANREGYANLLEIFRTSDSFEERLEALAALGGSSDPYLMLEALDFSLSSEVPGQDMRSVFSRLHVGCSMRAWLWLKDNWDKVYEKVGEGFLLRSLVTFATSKLWNEDEEVVVRDFIAGHIPKFPRTAEQCGEVVKLGVSRIKRAKEEHHELELLI